MTASFARVETGLLKIADDTPGIFIRGDTAIMGYAPALMSVLNEDGNLFAQANIPGLLRLLRSCDAASAAEVRDIAVEDPDFVMLTTGPVQIGDDWPGVFIALSAVETPSTPAGFGRGGV